MQKADKIKKNETKKANERQSQKHLKTILQVEEHARGFHPEKKLRKQQILNAAIQYINHLMKILDEPPIGEAQSPAMSSSTSEVSKTVLVVYKLIYIYI